MKTIITKGIIHVSKFILNIIYFFLKLFPCDEKKILFCSRQSNELPLDFSLIQNHLDLTGIHCVNICCHMGSRRNDYIKFIKCMFTSMYHLATSKLCIIDSYWPAVSLLKHKKKLKIIQIWHAIGKIKKSGYQTLGKKSGRKSEYAYALNMHKNYDYVIAGASVWNKYYCESFNISEDKILNYGLPRIDYLLNTEEYNRKKFFCQFPEFRDKKIILYAPTFRRNMKSGWEKIIDSVNKDYVLIIKKHPGEYLHTKKTADNVYYLENWKTIDLIAVCDYFITDYSAAALEAAVLKKKTYYWLYDYKEYIENNGLNINLKSEAELYAFKDIGKLMESICCENYDMNFIERYRRKYLPENLGHATDNIVDLIKKLMNE